MNRFWEMIIKPIFNEVKPNLIVEIGSDVGLNTKKILDYCYENGSIKLISIDPAPSFDTNSLKKKFPNNFFPIRDMSLNALKMLKSYDIILIDGDHNWYTVYNELKIIEENFKQTKFPLIIFHDVSWPYGRRDMYYNPDLIPSDFRNEYKQLGMKPNHNELLREGGVNAHLNNALFENTPKNGVLTAIEDFLKISQLDLTFYKINGFNGLGILFPKNNSFSNFISNLVYKSNLGEVVEKIYLDKIINQNLLLNSQRRIISHLNKRNKQYIKKIQTLNSINLKNENEMVMLKENDENHIAQITKLNERLSMSQMLIKKNIQYEKRINKLKKNNEFYQIRIAELNKEINEYNLKIQNLSIKNLEYEDKLIQSTNDNESNKTIINNLNNDIVQLKSQISELMGINDENKLIISNLNVKNDENKLIISNLNVKNDENKLIIDDLNQSIMDLKSELNTLNDSSNYYQIQIQKLIRINSKIQSQNQILKDSNETYKNTLDSFKEINENLVINNKVLTINNERILSDKNQLINVNSKLNEIKDRLMLKNEELDNKNNQIVSQNVDLKNKFDELNEIKGKLNAKVGEYIEKENENLATIQALNQEKKSLQAEVNQLKEIISEMKSSNSWKLTKPFRKIKS